MSTPPERPDWQPTAERRYMGSMQPEAHMAMASLDDGRLFPLVLGPLVLKVADDCEDNCLVYEIDGHHEHYTPLPREADPLEPSGAAGPWEAQAARGTIKRLCVAGIVMSQRNLCYRCAACGSTAEFAAEWVAGARAQTAVLECRSCYARDTSLLAQEQVRMIEIDDPRPNPVPGTPLP